VKPVYDSGHLVGQLLARLVECIELIFLVLGVSSESLSNEAHHIHDLARLRRFLVQDLLDHRYWMCVAFRGLQK
jgi:hypothetical protein